MKSMLEMKKGAMPLYIIILVLVVAIMIMLRQCSVDRIPPKEEKVASGDTVTVAIEISPNGLSLEGDTLSGEYYDLIREVFAKHGRPVAFIPYTRLDDAVNWLAENRCRMVAGDIPVTAAMRDRLLFLQPVAIDRQVLVQVRDTSGRFVQSQFELGNRRVHVPASSPYIERLRNLSHEIGDTIYMVEDADHSPEQLVVLTAIGQIPLAVVNRSTAEALKEKYPQIDCSVPVSFNQYQSWAVARGDSAMLDTLNRWFAPYRLQKLPL